MQKTKVNEINNYLWRARNTGEEIHTVSSSAFRRLGNISLLASSNKVKLITHEMLSKKILRVRNISGVKWKKLLIQKITKQANPEYLMWTVNSFRIGKPARIASGHILLGLEKTYNLNFICRYGREIFWSLGLAEEYKPTSPSLWTYKNIWNMQISHL